MLNRLNFNTKKYTILKVKISIEQIEIIDKNKEVLIFKSNLLKKTDNISILVAI